ncbi:MAG: hypothetical protein JWQ10_1280 [Herbaspirillum sp.]|nr:hypothetical protein [Herbaspirillum sp.]
MFKILVFSLAVLLSGCASITGSSTQPISVQTKQGSSNVLGVSCTLTNDAGKWFVKTPGSVTVKKSTGDLTVECANNDASGRDHVGSTANVNVWGNLLVGGLVGYAVDRYSGAGFDYPKLVTIELDRGTLTSKGTVAGTGGKKQIVNGRWNALMACDANRFRNDRPAYQTKFIAEVNGDQVTLHRKNAVVEEVLSGTVAGDGMELNGMGYRLQQSNLPWQFKFSGNFTGNAKIYTAKGDMLTNASRSVRSCTIIMVDTEVEAPVKDDDGEGRPN